MINQLPERLKEEILQYCKLNDIEDMNSFIIKLIRQSLTIEKFGYYPDFVKDKVETKQEEVIEIKINEYSLEVDLKKKDEVISGQTVEVKVEEKPQPIKKTILEDDIYGENNWLPSNLKRKYDAENKRKK